MTTMVTAQKKKQLKLRMAVSRSKNKQDLKIEPTHHLSQSEVIFKAVLIMKTMMNLMMPMMAKKMMKLKLRIE